MLGGSICKDAFVETYVFVILRCLAAKQQERRWGREPPVR